MDAWMDVCCLSVFVVACPWYGALFGLGVILHDTWKANINRSINQLIDQPAKDAS